MKREINLIEYDAEGQSLSGEIIAAKGDYFEFEECVRQENKWTKIIYRFDPSREGLTRQ